MSDTVSALYVVNVDASGLRRLTLSDLMPGDATWSPDGTRIAFEAELVFDGRPGPWVIDAESLNAVSLHAAQDVTVDWDGFSDPVWSPDGSLIMMLQGRHEPGGKPITAGLATIHPDGSGLAFVDDGTGIEHQPDWSATAAC